MTETDVNELASELTTAAVNGSRRLAIVGFTESALRLIGKLRGGPLDPLLDVFANVAEAVDVGSTRVLPLRDLRAHCPDVVVIAADEEKEDLLLEALPFLVGTPKILIAGYRHFAFRDPILAEELQKLLVPSLANGYPHTLTHLYQCLSNAARLGLSGAVAEFGMFKGGTTMLLSRLTERLGMDWPVFGFDTFAGFPSRRSPLDMYNHPGCVFTDVESVRRWLAGRNVTLVVGDIVETCKSLWATDLVLTFIDTDNYTSAKAAIEVSRDRTVIGGAIVFDHFTGTNRFKYTLGERLAALELLANDARYFNLHGTGVFLRQR